MYSALSTLLQTRHLKQPRCQCLSRATRDCSFLNSFPQPQQSEDTNLLRQTERRTRFPGRLEVLTVHGLDGRRAVGRERLGALLADALLPVERHSVASRKRLSARDKG